MRTNGNCTMMSWGIAAALGVLAFLLLVGSNGFGTALFLGIVAFVLLGLLFQWLFCAPLPKAGETGVTAEPSGGDSADTSASKAQAPSTAAAASAGAAAASAASASTAEKPAEDTEPEPDPQPVAETAPVAEAATSDAPEEPEPAPSAQPAPESAEADAEDSADEFGSRVKPSTPLAGEADLASRKGSWTYRKSEAEPEDATLSGSADGAAGSVDGAKVQSAPDAGDAKEAAAEADKADTAGEGSKPALLDGPEGGTPDDLKQIKGIGPKLEQVCHSIGVYHFHQIAAWTEDEVAWADANLVGFKGRVSRDNWVSQARLLAEGGETEFSTRVQKGGVYE